MICICNKAYQAITESQAGRYGQLCQYVSTQFPKRFLRNLKHVLKVS